MTMQQKTQARMIPDAPAPGKTCEIAPGLHWIRNPLSFELKHINLWLLDGETGWSIIDAGFNEPETLGHWEAIFSAHVSAQKPVENIIITHFHPDHFGLAGHLARKTDKPVRLTPGEWRMVQSLTDHDSADTLEALYRPYYRDAGVDAETTERMLQKRMLYQKIISAPPQEVSFIHPGETLRLGRGEWQVVLGEGHSPEHACLYNAADGIFISGDIVLPRITPNISFFPGNPPGHDPVASYISTLERLRRTIPDDVLVLPSHGDPFTGLHARIDATLAHHAKRMQTIVDILRQKPATAYETTQALFAHRDLGTSDMFFALGETLAHLVHGVRRGDITEKMEDGTILYGTAG